MEVHGAADAGIQINTHMILSSLFAHCLSASYTLPSTPTADVCLLATQHILPSLAMQLR